jgi:hypothetical protein
MKHISPAKAAIATTTFACASLFSFAWSEQGIGSLSVVCAQASIDRPLAATGWGYYPGGAYGWGWDSGPYAGYLGTDWEHQDRRYVGWGYHPRYLPLSPSVYYYYVNPLHGY